MIAVAGTAMILAGIGIFAIKQSQYNSFDFQLAQAESEFSNKDYESALKYLDRALSLNAESVEANILAAKIYMLKEDTDTARSILLTVIKSDPKSVSAYGELLRLYEKEENVEEIRKLMDACDVEKIKEYYSDYISVLPLVTKESGSYEELITVEFSDVEEGSKIYYTLDGSDPTADSTLYEGSIALEEGNTELRYIAYNAKGIPSETGDELYKITLKAPEPPTITPTSGEYEYYQSITVIVPEGCKAYYAFDEEPTTDSTLYTGPVDMPYNEHIFSAILVDENGKISTPASETFVMYE